MLLRSSPRALLVDDAEDVLRLAGHFLSEAGAEVVTANCGDQALKLAAEQEFDLVLLDVEMPGISGPDVGKTLRQRGVTIPIIAFTANDDEATRKQCLDAGCPSPSSGCRFIRHGFDINSGSSWYNAYRYSTRTIAWRHTP